MASAYSILHNYSQELYTPNFELINTGLQSRQGALNANRAKTQAMLDEMDFLDLVKDGDKEYAEQRLQQARAIVDKYAALDLSSNNLTDQLVHKIGETVDGTVKNALVSTKIYRAEQAEWQTLKEEAPEKYSQLNHAYANRASNAWLNDGQVGSKYRGGGGAIEYVDVGAKIMENLPKLQEALHAEYKVTGPQQGYFMSLDTYEAVDPGKLRQAMDFVFDEKVNRQMSINAWGAYDQMPDEQLRQVVNGTVEPKIKNVEAQITATKELLSKAKNDQQRQAYSQEIEDLRNYKVSLEENLYDNAVATKGREGAYTSFYHQQYRDKVVNTYSYQRLIDREVDPIQKENLKHQLELDKFEWQKMKDMRDMMAKAGDTSVGGGPTLGTPIEGLPTPELESTGLDFLYAGQDAAYDNMTTALTNAGIAEEDLKAVLQSPEFKNILKNPNASSTVTLNGKTFDVASNLAILDEYKNKVLNTDPRVAKAMEGVRGMVKEVNNQLQRTYVLTAQGARADMNFKNLPNFDFKLVKDASGKYVAEDVMPQDGVNNYEELLRKGSNRTEAENKTLEYYTTLHMINDPSLSDTQRRLVMDSFNNMKVADLDAASSSRLTTGTAVDAAGYYAHTYTKAHYGNTGYARGKSIPSGSRLSAMDIQRSDFYLSDYTAGDTQISTTQQSVGSGILDIVSGVNRLTGNTVAAEGAERLSQTVLPEGLRAKGLNAIIEQGMKHIAQTTTDAVFARDQQLATSRQIIFDSQDQNYGVLRAKAGIRDPKYAKDITVEQEFDAKGNMTNNAIIRYEIDNPDKEAAKTQPTILVPKVISQDELRSSGIVDMQNAVSGYSADGSKAITLGNGIYTDTQRIYDVNVNAAASGYTSLGREDYEATVANARAVLGDVGAAKVQQKIVSFLDGGFDFNIVASGGAWVYSVTDDEGVQTLLPIPDRLKPEQSFSNEDRAMFYLNPTPYIESAFEYYLTDYTNKRLVSEVLKNQ